MYMHIHIYIYIHTHVCMCVYIYIYIYIYIGYSQSAPAPPFANMIAGCARKTNGIVIHSRSYFTCLSRKLIFRKPSNTLGHMMNQLVSMGFLENKVLENKASHLYKVAYAYLYLSLSLSLYIYINTTNNDTI